MTKLLSLFTCAILAVFSPSKAFSQYILNGSAIKETCNCYLLTPAEKSKSGSVWQQTKINLNDPFDFKFNVYLGCLDATGADGIVFMLQPLSTNLGTYGGGLGFQGVAPSIGIALDTWQNFEDNDPAYDHISIQANGVIKHGNDLAGPIPASASSDNIEDCNWHTLRITWDPSSHTINSYFDGIFRLSSKIDMVADIFKNDPMVYWGFSAATGGSFNVQKFCTSLNPNFSSGLKNDAICFGTPVNFRDSSTSFTSVKNFHWDFGDGTTSTLADPPPHNYTQPGLYDVKYYITAADGCESETNTKKITIGDKPDLSFRVFDTCETFQPRIEISANFKYGKVVQWNWELDGSPFSNVEQIDLSKVAAGNHSLRLTVATDVGCISNSYSANFNIKNAPGISINANDGCVHAPILFAGQTDPSTSVDKWHWNFGDNVLSEDKNTQHIYSLPSSYSVQLSATGSNGCIGFASKNIKAIKAIANAGKDTIVIQNTLFQLLGSGGSSYTWTPSTGLSNPSISNPVGTAANDIRYVLTIKTPEGCTDTASINITVFKGSAIYVPTAFTPNNDGLNDILKPNFIGIKTLYYFTIYNRWGQKVFSTNDVNKGWNGYIKGNIVDGESFAWVLKAVDQIGKIYDLKGTFVLLK